MNQSERIPLHRGDMLELVFQGLGGQTYIQRAEVEEMIGEGASCLSYIVRLHTSESSSTRMIMKEFYPCDTELEPGIRREGGRLQVTGLPRHSSLAAGTTVTTLDGQWVGRLAGAPEPDGTGLRETAPLTGTGRSGGVVFVPAG